MMPMPTREASLVSRALPQPGLYRHFKGGEYEVMEVARHSETEELLVIYCSVDDPTTTWVRPLEMFSGMIDSPEGSFPRFELTATTKLRCGPLTRLLRHLLRPLARRDTATAPRAIRLPPRRLVGDRHRGRGRPQIVRGRFDRAS
jgi:hypothetical protein